MQLNERERKHWNFLVQKREEVLKQITPICKAHGIHKFDYLIDEKTFDEHLQINDTLIGCKATSYERIVTELVGYLFIQHWQNQYLGDCKPKVFQEIRRYWRKNG